MSSACQGLDEFSEAREKYSQATQELGGIWEVVQASPILYMGRPRPSRTASTLGLGYGPQSLVDMSPSVP